MRRFLVLFFVSAMFASLIAAGTGTASAQQYNHRITVYAYVPEMRAIYIDRQGNLVKVAGNTTRNITPQAFDTGSKLITMASSYMNQYQLFLARHGGKLEAGKVYIIRQNELKPMLDLKPIKAVHGENQTNNQTGGNYRYIGPKMKMALVY